MSWILSWITMFLVWLSADHHSLALEDARAAAAVASAKAAVLDRPRHEDDEVDPQSPKPLVPVCPNGKCQVK